MIAKRTSRLREVQSLIALVKGGCTSKGIRFGRLPSPFENGNRQNMVYRRHTVEGNKIWHFNQECPRWPVFEYIQVYALAIPTISGNLCEQCIELEWPLRHGSARH